MTGAHLLLFTLDGHRFGLHAADVREILRAAAPSPLPGAPTVVIGVLDVRGALLPVYDIRSRFRLEPRALRHTDHLIAVRAGARSALVAVEEVEDLVHVPAADVEQATGVASRTGWVAGVAKLPDGTVVLLDLAAFLTEAEGDAVDAALAAAREA